MHILVTGASGFCGGFMTAELAARHCVTAISRRSPTTMMHPAVRWVTSDLLALDRVPSDVDLLVHAAAHVPRDGADAASYARDNVAATAHLLQLASAAGVARVLFVSSISVLGEVTAPVVDERTPVVNPAPYGASKLLAEAVVGEASSRIPAVIVRLPAVLGPHASRHWLADVRERAAGGTELRIRNADAPFNNAVHIADLTRFAEQLAAREWTGAVTLTLAAATTLTTRGVVERIVAASHSTSPIVETSGAGSSFVILSQSATRDWGYSPMSLESMLDRFVAENTEQPQCARAPGQLR